MKFSHFHFSIFSQILALKVTEEREGNVNEYKCRKVTRINSNGVLLKARVKKDVERNFFIALHILCGIMISRRTIERVEM